MKCMLARSLSIAVTEQKKQEYLAAIEPFIKMKVRIMNISVPKLLDKNGVLTRVYSKETQKLLDMCDVRINVIQRKIERLNVDEKRK